MLSKSAVSKLKAVLIIDIIIVSLAAGIFLYLQNTGLIATGVPKPAEFIASDLVISPAETEIYEPVLISINLTNLGDEDGSYMANLTINSQVEQNQTIMLGGHNSTLVEFSVLKEVVGNYTVELGGLFGALKINPLSATSSTIGLSSLIIDPYEGWVDVPLTATVNAFNQGAKNETLTIRLMIDNALIETKIITLAAGESTTLVFTFNSTIEGKHQVKVNSLSGSFTIVKTGYHTLNINRSGGGNKPLVFELDGVTHSTPYSELLPVGKYKISAPEIVDVGTGIVGFDYWNTGSKSPTITIDLQSRLFIVATYYLISGYASCPSLYYWNGTDYVHVSEVSNAGWLGYIDYMDENGNMVFGGGNPWDYVKLVSAQLAPNNGYYDMILFQQWDEIFYIDAAYMVVVDHPANVDVYSTMVNYVNPAAAGQIYSVGKDNILTPVSAVNEQGEDVLSQIAKLDGVFTTATNGVESPAWNSISINQMTLNLGNLTGAQSVKLIVNGMVDWGPAEPYYEWINKFDTAYSQGLVPNGTQVNPPPYMEIKDTNGNWVRVPQDRQLPIPADYIPRSFVVDLTGLFPDSVDEYCLRINNFWNVTFDYIGIDTTPQANIKIQTVYPIAILEPPTYDTHSVVSGSFTRYGDVSQLLVDADDMYVIGMQGDQVNLKFPTADLPPVADGMERDYFLFVACWFKDPPGNWGYGFDFTVNPLPFVNMSGFPYPPSESYPYDAAHLQYLQVYNTRIVNPP